MYLNLDNSFTPFGEENNVFYTSFNFTGGEPHIKIDSDLKGINEVTITTRVTSFNDFGLLLCAIDALKRINVDKINLFLPYFPGARQDRLMNYGEPLTVKLYADILNNLKLSQVIVFDPHSEVTPAVINNCKIISNHLFIKEVFDRIAKETLLVSPDGGALKKIYKVSEFLGGIEVIECSKKRNVKNGKLEGFKVYAEDLKGKDCIIVDDICDGGGTFIGLAKELKSKNVGNLYLAVSHGIFSKGLEDLNKYYERIFVTNSFKDMDGVELVNLKELI